MKKQNSREKEKMGNSWKKLLLFDIIAVALIFLLANTNILLSPSQISTTSQNISFNWVGLQQKIMIDDNLQFTSPIITERKSIELEPGTYYWKTTGLSIAKQFTIDSEVGLIIEQKNKTTYSARNTGNIRELISIIKKGTGFITGQAILEINESRLLNTNDSSMIMAEQKEKQENK